MSCMGLANGSALFGCDGCSMAGADRTLTNCGGGADTVDGPAAEYSWCGAEYVHGRSPLCGGSRCSIGCVARPRPPASSSPPYACAQQARRRIDRTLHSDTSVKLCLQMSHSPQGVSFTG